MDWFNLLAGNEAVTRVAAIAAFGAGSLYVAYSLLNGLITSRAPAPPGATNVTDGASRLTFGRPTTSLRSRSPVDQRVTCRKKSSLVGPPPLSVEDSIELVRQYISASPIDGSTVNSLSSSCPALSVGLRGGQHQREQQIDEQTDRLAELLEDLRYNGARLLTAPEVENLSLLLMAPDERLLCETLGIVTNCAAFTANQNAFREHGVLRHVRRLVRHDCDAIKVQALNATANLCVNDANQCEFVDDLPHYLLLCFHDGCSMLSLVALCVLTNLTLKYGGHPEVLQHVSSLASKAVCATPDQSLQALKVLVNISCDEAGVEHLVVAEIREDFFDLIRSEPSISQRCLTIIANLIPKIVEGSRLENRFLELKGAMLDMWRQGDLDEAQKEQLERCLRALQSRGWGRLPGSTINLSNS